MQLTSPRLCGGSQTDLAEYLRQVRPIALLTRSQEQDLARRIRTEGDDEARDQLICANLRLVVYTAKRYAGIGVPLQDLIEAGNIGLIQAVSRFDPDQGTRFSTYAVWWIRRAISNAFAEHGCLIRVPRGRRRADRARRSVEQRLLATLGRPATDEEVARSSGLSLSEVRRTHRMPTVSAGEDGAMRVGAAADRDEPRPDQAAGQKELTERLRKCLHRLPGTEAEIVRLRFGIGGRPALTMADIARELNMTQAAVARLLEAAMSRLQVRLGADLQTRRVPPARVAAG